MSKLGLGRAKLASSVQSAFVQEPPDKKRKTDHDSVTADAAWDDDLDILLTQNMNKLDSLVASTQSAVQNGYDGLAGIGNDMSHRISTSTMDSVRRHEAEHVCSDTGKQTVSSTGKRLIGHGSNHSRSADCLDSSAGGSSLQLARKDSFSAAESSTRHKGSDKLQSWSSFQAKQAACSSTHCTNTVKDTRITDTMTISTLPRMRLDANANCAESKLTQITEECEYYKAEVCVLSAFVY